MSHQTDYDACLQEYYRLKAKYKGQIEIKFGIEFWIQQHMIPKFEQDFARYDFVILSNHQMDD